MRWVPFASSGLALTLAALQLVSCAARVPAEDSSLASANPKNLSSLIPRLPPVLMRLYGHTSVRLQKTSERVSVDFHREKQVEVGGPKSSVKQRIPAFFRVRVGFSQPDRELRHNIHRAFMESFVNEAYPGAIANGIFRELRPRLVDFGAAKLSGLDPPPDRLAELWWQLRLVGEEPRRPPQRGDWVLYALWLRGYKNSSPYGFGHSAIGLRRLGSEGHQDRVISPGPWTKPGVNAGSLELLVGSPRVANVAELWNLWDWAEVMVEKRYLRVDVRLLPLSSSGLEFYRRLVDELEGGDWGHYSALTNSCAHGALDLLNAVLPLDREIDRTPILVPGEVMEGASRLFPEWGRFELQPPPLPAGIRSTPPLLPPTYRGARERSGTYRRFVDKESKLIDGLGAQRKAPKSR